MIDELASIRDSERRLRILMVPRHVVLEACFPAFVYGPGPMLSLRRLPVPRDASIVEVHYDYAYASFAFMVSHPSFAPVAHGAAIPIMTTINMESFTVALQEQSARDWLDSLRGGAADRDVKPLHVAHAGGDPARAGI